MDGLRRFAARTGRRIVMSPAWFVRGIAECFTADGSIAEIVHFQIFQFPIFHPEIFQFEAFEFGVFQFGVCQFDFFNQEGREPEIGGLQDWQSVMAGEVGSSFPPLGHRYVNVLKDLARSNAEDSFGRFDQIIALVPAMLATEMIGEAESVVEFPGFDQEAGAISLPFQRFHGAVPVRHCQLRYRVAANPNLQGPGQAAFFVRAKENVRRKWALVNSAFWCK